MVSITNKNASMTSGWCLSCLKHDLTLLAWMAMLQSGKVIWEFISEQGSWSWPCQRSNQALSHPWWMLWGCWGWHPWWDVQRHWKWVSLFGLPNKALLWYSSFFMLKTVSSFLIIDGLLLCCQQVMIFFCEQFALIIFGHPVVMMLW